MNDYSQKWGTPKIKVEAKEEIKDGWQFANWIYPIRNEGAMYKAIAHIRNNETGEVVQHETSVCMDDNGDPDCFNWEENNFSCDCNRGLFFYREKGLDDPDYPCDMNAFSANLSNPVDGKVFYREFE